MVQVGVTGEDIGFSEAHGKLAGVCVKLHAGFIFGKKLLENTAVSVCLTETAQDFSLFIQDLNGKIDTLVKSFEHFVKMMTIYNII